MPLYKIITVDGNTKIAIWKVEESLDQLDKGIELTQHCERRFHQMKSLLHKRAFMSIRHLLDELGYVDHDMYYDNFGKPHLKNGNFISITHSYQFTAIIISDKTPVGIDIEKQRDKIIKIAPKFTPLNEYKTLANDDAIIRKLTIVWGAKESLYKIYGTKGLSFLQHINVTDFSFQEGFSTAIINYHGKKSHYDIAFMEFEGFTCVYALTK
ncbi:MAG: 4'-phosphopantetheinyl transferase superfamily protein [Leeuwenhoekiella sp.]